MNTFVNLWLLILQGFALIHGDDYNSYENYRNDSKYGKTWAYFPDANGIPRQVFFLGNDSFSSRIGFDMKESVTFTLYTRNNPEYGQVLLTDEEVLRSSNYNERKATKIVTHGWLSSGNSTTCIQIKDEYLKTYDCNVIVVDWGVIAGNVLYHVPVVNTRNVAEFYANFLDFLVEHGTELKKVHLIGHSLGAHVSGFVGDLIKTGKVGRITGLDPALPLFDIGLLTDRKRLSKENADFVDVIHTCGGVLGFYEALGHADFYPNKGKAPQPGCFGVSHLIEACSHGRSWKYFSESINENNYFVATKCASWASFNDGSCTGDRIEMGDRVPNDARGKYYLRTAADEPFALEAVSDNYVKLV